MTCIWINVIAIRCRSLSPRQVLPLGALNGQEHREGDGGSLGTVVYCLHTADTPDVARVGDFLFLWNLR